MPFKITEQDIECSSLEADDIGKWAIIINGCWYICESEEEGRELLRYIEGRHHES